MPMYRFASHCRADLEGTSAKCFEKAKVAIHACGTACVSSTYRTYSRLDVAYGDLPSLSFCVQSSRLAV